jgi:hypothetical protein
MWGLRKINTNLSHNCWYRGRDPNRAPLVNKPRVLPLHQPHQWAVLIQFLSCFLSSNSLVTCEVNSASLIETHIVY